MKPTKSIARTVTAGALLLLVAGAPEPLLAYGGPGSVISGIAALLAAVAAIGAAIFGFVWFPLKRLLRKVRGDSEEGGGAEAGDAPAGE